MPPAPRLSVRNVIATRHMAQKQIPVSKVGPLLIRAGRTIVR
jgi:hypothetical protein